MLRVATLGTFLNPDRRTDGFSNHSFNLSRWLSRLEDANVTMVSFGEADETRMLDRYRFIMMRRGWSYKRFPLIPLLRIALILRREKPDLIHIQGTTFTHFLVYALTLSPRNVPKVVTVHGHPAEEGVARGCWKKDSFKAKLIGFGEDLTARSADAILFVTTKLRNEWTVKYGEHNGPDYYTIMNAVDPDEFSCKADSNIGGVRLVVLSAKALVPPNGQEYLVRAFPRILEAVPDARLLIAGEGPDRFRLERIAAEIGVQSRISFLGCVPNKEMPDLMSRTTIFVAPSIRMGEVEEGSSIVVLEAMASGVPVIATDVGGLVELVSNGKTGILVQERDPGAISDAVLDLYAHPERRKEMARAAREYVLLERTWEQVAFMHMQIYRSLMRKRERGLTR